MNCAPTAGGLELTLLCGVWKAVDGWQPIISDAMLHGRDQSTEMTVCLQI